MFVWPMCLCAYIFVLSFVLSHYTLVYLSEQYLTICSTRLQTIYMRVFFLDYSLEVLYCVKLIVRYWSVLCIGLYYMVLQLLMFIELLYMVKLLSISLYVKVIVQAWLEILQVYRDKCLYAYIRIAWWIDSARHDIYMNVWI